VDGLSFAAMASIIGLLYGVTILIETTVALLFGYRNKVFLSAIVLVNVPTTIVYQYYSFQLFQTFPINPSWTLLGYTTVVTIFELGLLKGMLYKKYTWAELLILVPVMNLVSFLVFYLFSGWIY
jgi:hypothetical protein